MTGGGTGLGKATALELARCGASVLIAGRRAEVLEEAVAEIGPSADWIAGDIREREEASGSWRARWSAMAGSTCS